MNIKFQSIHLNNFLSFGDASIKLDRGCYVLVKGENNNTIDNAESNGSGKSAIFDGIVWALTGDTIRGSKNVCNLYTENGAKVELIFDIDGNNYKIVRYKDHKPEGTTLKIFINGEDKSGKGIRDTEKLLSEYLPELTSYLISSVIVLGQGLPQRFTNNTPAGRKDILEQLSKSDFMIEDIKYKISTRKEDLISKINNSNTEIISSNTELSALLSENTRLQDALDKYMNDDVESQLEQSSLELVDIQKDEDICKQLVSEYQEEYDKLNEQLNNILIKRATELQNIDSEYSELIQEKSSLKVKLQLEIDSLKKEIQSLESISDICPTCKQKLVGVQKPDTSDLHNKLEDNVSALQVVVDYLDDIDKQKKIKKEYSLQTIENDKVNIEEKISSIRIKKKDSQENMKQLSSRILSLKTHIASLSSRKSLLQQDMNNIRNRLQEIQEKKVYLQDTILYNNSEKESNESRLAVINKLNTIVSRDFRGVLLTNVISFIDKQAKLYSQQVFGNECISFCLNSNAIEISFDGKEYSNLSGGERQKIDVIIQLSLRDMLCKFLNFSSNIIVLDELFDNLDSKGCQNILDLISKNLSDVETVYIITHHADISIPTDDEIIIVKDTNKVSSVR